MMRHFFYGLCWGLLIVGAFFGWGSFITSQLNQCGDDKVSIAHWGHGVYCVQGEKWKP